MTRLATAPARAFALLAFAAIVAGSACIARAADSSDRRPEPDEARVPRALSPLARQTSDAQIDRDRRALDHWSSVVEEETGALAADPWRRVAAREWLRAARAEYEKNDATGFPQAAFARAMTLIAETRAGRAPMTAETVPTAVPPRGSMRVADSLYVELERLKRDPGFACGREALAELEVALATAGNEQLDHGDCGAAPHLSRARALADLARRAAANCAADAGR